MDAAPLLKAETVRAGRRHIALLLGGAAFVSLGLVALASTQQKPQDFPVQPQAPAALAADSGRVSVQLYGMAGCPYTRGFIEGPVAEMLATLGDHVHFEFFPFGNSYYATEACGGADDSMPYASYFRGYNATVRQCWDNLCGAAAAEPAADCFSGQLLCQHGETDCLVTKAWACAKTIGDNERIVRDAAPWGRHEAADSYMPFVECTARRFLGVTSAASLHQTLSECIRDSPLVSSRAELLSCAAGPRGVELYNAQARATVPHAGVPYALVEGRVVSDTGCVACGDGLIQRVCEALRAKGGAETPVCAGIFGEI